MRPGAAEEAGEALVIARHPWRDGVIAVLLTAESRRRDMAVPHAKRSRARLEAHLDPPSRCEVSWREEPHRDLAVLTRATAIETFPTLRGDLVRMALGFCVCEVTALVVAEGGAEPGLYELALGALRAIDDPAREAAEELLLYFELRVLGVAGVLPPLEASRGLVDERAREVLAGWLGGRWQRLERAGRRAVAGWLETQVAEVGGRPLRSRAFLDEVLSKRP